MKKVLFLVLAVVSLNVASQDLSHYKRVVKELASRKYQGRGYAKGGANKAGLYLQREYGKAGVDEVTLQPFTLDIQTFSGKMEMQALSDSPLKGEKGPPAPSLKGETSSLPLRERRGGSSFISSWLPSSAVHISRATTHHVPSQPAYS